MMTRKQLESGGPPENQHGAAASLSQCVWGTDKNREVGKPPKIPKGTVKDPPEICYTTLKD